MTTKHTPATPRVKCSGSGRLYDERVSCRAPDGVRFTCPDCARPLKVRDHPFIDSLSFPRHYRE